MSITISITNPAEHAPSELRAVAHFLNCLAADREGNVRTLEVATPGAPSASDDTPPPVPADADAGSEPNTSDASELDSAGHPWDERIHSAGRTRTADGTWRKKKGVDLTLVDQVIAELTGSTEPEADTPPPVPEAEDTPPPVPAAEPEAEDTPPPVVTEEAVTPAACFKFVTENKIKPDQIEAALAMAGMTKMNEVFAKPAKAGELLEALKQVTA